VPLDCMGHVFPFPLEFNNIWKWTCIRCHECKLCEERMLHCISDLRVSQLCKSVQMNCCENSFWTAADGHVTFHDMTWVCSPIYHYIKIQFIITKTIYIQWKFTRQFSDTLRTKWNTNSTIQAWNVNITSRCSPVQAVWRGLLSLSIVTALGHCWPTVIKSVEESQ